MVDEKQPDTNSPRERILRASIELFVEQGYFRTNIPDISKRSRCSVGSIYHHFLNKEDIANQLYVESIARFRSALFDSIEDEEDPRRAVHALVVAFLAFAEKNPQIARYIWLTRHTEFLSGEIARPTMVGFDGLGRKLTRILREGVREKILTPLPAEILWNILFGLPASFVQDWLDGYSKISPTDAAEDIANACWGALSLGKQ